MRAWSINNIMMLFFKFAEATELREPKLRILSYSHPFERCPSKKDFYKEILQDKQVGVGP